MNHIPSKKLLQTKLNKIGIIDIGSNAMRFSVAHYKPREFYEILHRTRVPLRLGDSVFHTGKIPSSKIQLTSFFFEQFKEIAQIYNIKEIRAVATSAVRDAKNKRYFINEIFKRTQIKIQPISGLQEAALIHLAITTHTKSNDYPCIIFDLGGGSLECIIVGNDGKFLASKSFNLGTVRMLEILNLQGKRLAKSFMQYHLTELIEFINSFSLEAREYNLFGTGGNLRRMGKLRNSILKKRSTSQIEIEEISKIKTELNKHNYLDRAVRYRMRIDRSEVIIPSLMIFEYLMKKLKAKSLNLPELALTDGLIIDSVDRHHLI